VIQSRTVVVGLWSILLYHRSPFKGWVGNPALYLFSYPLILRGTLCFYFYSPGPINLLSCSHPGFLYHSRQPVIGRVKSLVRYFTIQPFFLDQELAKDVNSDQELDCLKSKYNNC